MHLKEGHGYFSYKNAGVAADKTYLINELVDYQLYGSPTMDVRPPTRWTDDMVNVTEPAKLRPL